MPGSVEDFYKINNLIKQKIKGLTPLQSTPRSNWIVWFNKHCDWLSQSTCNTYTPFWCLSSHYTPAHQSNARLNTSAQRRISPRINQLVIQKSQSLWLILHKDLNTQASKSIMRYAVVMANYRCSYIVTWFCGNHVIVIVPRDYIGLAGDVCLQNKLWS